MSPADGPLGFDPETPRPPAVPPRPPAPAGVSGHRYAWLLGIVAILAVAALTIRATGPDAPRASGVRAGKVLPPFAVVRSTSGVVCDQEDDPCDANIADSTSGARVRGAGRRPACEVRGSTVLNVCELAERGPLVLGFAASRGASCLDAFDRLTSLARRHPGLQVALVAIGGGLKELRASVRACGRAAGASPSAGTAMASWPASTAWPPVPPSPSRAGAGGCRARSSVLARTSMPSSSSSPVLPSPSRVGPAGDRKPSGCGGRSPRAVRRAGAQTMAASRAR